MNKIKSHNKKQIAHSNRKVANAIAKLYGRFILAVLAVITLSVVAVSLTGGDLGGLITFITGSGALGIKAMSMATIGSLDEISDRYSAANQIGMKVWLVARDQIDTDETFPNPNSDREVASIPLKAGEYMHYFTAIDNTPKSNGTGEKGEVTTDFTNTFSFILAGARKKSMDFLEEYAGKGFVVIYQECENDIKYVMGSYCKPMILQTFDRKDDNENRSITLTFQSKHWRQPAIYVGSITTQSPDTVAEDAATIAITSNDRYRLTDGSASSVTITGISGVGSDDYGRVVEILASETATYPSEIADNTTFVMIDGSTWTANPGSKISFKILDDSTMVEVAGSRVQTA